MGQLETMQEKIETLEAKVKALQDRGSIASAYGFGDGKALALFLGVSYSTVKRCGKNYPRYKQFGKYYYDFKEVAEFLKEESLKFI